MRLYDAHNHLQDERFDGRQIELVATCRAAAVTGMVVNGSCEADWPAVADLAQHHPDLVLPSFGYHPWYVAERTPDWEHRLAALLDTLPSAVGEIGLDRWKPGLPYADQEAVFTAQLRLAADRNRPVSIHCLQAWGRMVDLLRAGPRPACGFLLHSYGGPPELIPPLARLGAYFSFPGYYAHQRKARQRENFRHVPTNRLLIETDAPDQSLPDPLVRHPWSDGATPRPLNHPANLGAVYAFLAEFLAVPLDTLVDQVERNFSSLFGGVAPGGPASHPAP